MQKIDIWYCDFYYLPILQLPIQGDNCH